LVQQVLEVLIRELPRFDFNPQKGRFRGWLKGILINRLREFWRSEKERPLATGDSDFNHRTLLQLEDPNSDLSRLWDFEHDQHVGQQLLKLVRPDFAPMTWEAFLRQLRGERPAAVAADLGMSLNAVYLAKSSVLKRLRQEMGVLTE
jgi:RNA polymerase sigma-70 factor (ECF subfamily)